MGTVTVENLDLRFKSRHGEDVIALNPEVIVLSAGSANALRALPGITALRAVTDGHLLILADNLLEDPGPGLLDAAEALFRAAEEAVRFASGVGRGQ